MTGPRYHEQYHPFTKILNTKSRSIRSDTTLGDLDITQITTIDLWSTSESTMIDMPNRNTTPRVNRVQSDSLLLLALIPLYISENHMCRMSDRGTS
jgi:hypothetical protein